MCRMGAGNLLRFVDKSPTIMTLCRTDDFEPAELEKMIRQRTRTGRPCGGGDFVARLEGLIGRTLARQKPGPKPKTVRNNTNTEMAIK